MTDAIPAGMSEEDYWVWVNNQSKELQYARIMQPIEVTHAYALATDQNAHPVICDAALSYDREYAPKPRRLRR